MSKTVLLTGGAGFIGSHVAEALLGRGDEVVILDNFSDFLYPSDIKRRNVATIRGHQNAPDNLTVVEGDIRNVDDVRRAFNTADHEVVVHLAAVAGVRPSIEHPDLYDDINVLGTTRVLQAMREKGIRNLVFGSSSSVYGSTTPVPFSEKQGCVQPSSPYAATKRANELSCYTWHELYGFDVSCLRFFTVYGPRQRPEMAIHKFTRLIAEGKEIPVFGEGTPKRDYTFIADIVGGVLAAIDRPQGYQIYNLGTTDTTVLADLVRMIGDRLDVVPRVKLLPTQPGDVPITFADVSHAQRLLGYQVTTPIAQGLDVFIEWFKETNPAIKYGVAV